MLAVALAAASLGPSAPETAAAAPEIAVFAGAALVAILALTLLTPAKRLKKPKRRGVERFPDFPEEEETARPAGGFMLGLRRLIAGLLAVAPGGFLLWLYGERLLAIRMDPSRSPGTPAETVIALMVLGLALSGLLLGLGVVQGRIGRSWGAAGFMSVVVVTLVMSLAVLRPA